MIDKLKALIKRWSHEGMHWPFVHDSTNGKPSVTLMFLYMAYSLVYVTIMISSGLMLAKGERLQATYAPMLLFVLGFVFYRLRRLDSFKVDLDDASIELSDKSEEKEEDGKE